MGELCRTSNTDTSRQETNPDASPGEGKVDITNVRVRKQRREKEEGGGGGRGGGGTKKLAVVLMHVSVASAAEQG